MNLDLGIREVAGGETNFRCGCRFRFLRSIPEWGLCPNDEHLEPVIHEAFCEQYGCCLSL